MQGFGVGVGEFGLGLHPRVAWESKGFGGEGLGFRVSG